MRGYEIAGRSSDITGPYTAQLLGWSEDKIVSKDFIRLVDAIRWVAKAELDGALAYRAQIYSAQGAVVWAKLFRPRPDQRFEVMKRNSARILLRAFLKLPS